MKNSKKDILIIVLLLLFWIGAKGQGAEFDDSKKNIRFGIRALNGPQFTGTYNFTFGYDVLSNTTSGSYNIGIGVEALRYITTGRHNIAMGMYALGSSVNAGHSVALGNRSLMRNETGSYNVAIGVETLVQNMLSNNTAIGHEALKNNSGIGNTAIGYQAGPSQGNLTYLSNTTAIGASAVVNESNSIQLGNNDVTKVKAGGDNTTFYANQIQTANITTANITTTGKVGIGTNTLSSRLTVGPAPSGDSGPSFNIRSYGTETGANWAGAGAFGGQNVAVVLGEHNGVAHLGAHNAALNSWRDLQICTDGNVGVGKNPGREYKLDVNGIINATGFRIDGVPLTVSGNQWTTSGTAINYNAGSVGIGTTAPIAKLSFGTSLDDKLIGLYDHIYAFYGFGTRANELMMQSSGHITFWKRDLKNGGNGTLTETVRFTSDGNVGIGTSTPTEKLEVNGNIKATAIKFADGTTLSTATSNSVWHTAEGANIIYTSNNVGIGTLAPPTAKLEIGEDDENITTTMLKVHGGATFNNDGPDDKADKAKTTQVSINTNKKIKNAALTVAGVTFIGAWGELESLDNAEGGNNPVDDVVNGTIKDDYYNNFNLWVTKGIVSEDYTITARAKWADYVFNEGYKLPALTEVAAFIKENKHLPGVVSEKEVQTKGYNLHNVNQSFLEKIENLYLYSIAQEKTLKQQQEKINSMEKDLALLKAALLK